MDHDNELQKWETEFKKGFSKPLILFTLAENPTYPYQVTKSIIGKTKGKIAIAGSNIYPILSKLEESGLIIGKKEEENANKIYSLTNEGIEFLGLLKESMKDFIVIIQEMINTYNE